MSRHLRSIQLDLPVSPVEDDGDDAFYSRNTHETKHGSVTTERWRDGDQFHTRVVTDEAIPCDYGHEVRHVVEDFCRPAKIKFSWICEQAVVEPDEDFGPVWKECDGYEHDLEEDRHFDGPEDSFPCRRGYVRGLGKVITVGDNAFCGDSHADRYERFRKQGASKQVAREMVAQQDRDYIDYLLKQYLEGNDAWWVRIEFELEGETYEDSCGGCYGEEYARGEFVHEIAGNIAHSLKKDGWIIVGEPDSRAAYLENRRHVHRQRLNMFNWR